MLAIVAPMATELSGIRRAIRDPESRGVMFSLTGVGAARAQQGIRQVAESQPEAIIMLGFCGGADPDLAVGDLHVASCFKAPGAVDSIPADPELLSAWLTAARSCGARVVSGPSATVDAVAGPAAKSELRRSAGVASVNMEDYSAADTARALGIPFVSVRAVLDDATTELPRHLPEDPDNIARTLASLAIHPERIPAMLHLASSARTARQSLTRCSLEAIDCLTAPRTELSAVPR